MTIINFIVLNCRNLEKSLSFYQALGLEFQQEQHGKSPVHYSCQIENILLELYPVDREKVNRDTKVGFIVENIDEIINKLPTYFHSKKETNYGPMATLKDPDGMWILLYQDK